MVARGGEGLLGGAAALADAVVEKLDLELDAIEAALGDRVGGRSRVLAEALRLAFEGEAPRQKVLDVHRA